MILVVTQATIPAMTLSSKMSRDPCIDHATYQKSNDPCNDSTANMKK